VLKKKRALKTKAMTYYMEEERNEKYISKAFYVLKNHKESKQILKSLMGSSAQFRVVSL